MKTATAIILARAGSKGVPGKNIAPVAGRPCIAWTIAAAQNSKSVSRVVVSSDDHRALAVALEMGAMPMRRPAGLAHDTARVDDAARQVMEEVTWLGRPGRSAFSDWADEAVPAESPPRPDLRLVTDSADQPAATHPGPDQDAFVILYGNVPVRPADLIDRALRVLWETGCDSVQSYAPVGKHHPWWTARLGEDGEVAPWEGDVLNHGVFRRQDLPPAVIPDGGVIALTRAALALQIPGVAPGPHAFFGRDRRGVLNAEGDVIDIDSEIDLIVADTILRRQGHGAAASLAEDGGW